jgi:hypothetical protein
MAKTLQEKRYELAKEVLRAECGRKDINLTRIELFGEPEANHCVRIADLVLKALGEVK